MLKNPIKLSARISLAQADSLSKNIAERFFQKESHCRIWHKRQEQFQQEAYQLMQRHSKTLSAPIYKKLPSYPSGR